MARISLVVVYLLLLLFLFEFDNTHCFYNRRNIRRRKYPGNRNMQNRRYGRWRPPFRRYTTVKPASPTSEPEDQSESVTKAWEEQKRQFTTQQPPTKAPQATTTKKTEKHTQKDSTKHKHHKSSHS